jgi:hypothetical protein
MLDSRYQGLPPLARFVCAQLFIDCNLSSESVLLLIKEGKEWDADLISRSVMEGTFKFTYLLQGRHEDIERKANEYWEILPLFHRIRHSENVENFLRHIPDADEQKWRALTELTIHDSEVEVIRSQFSKSARRALEEQWSFFGICKSFASSENAGLRVFSSLAHGYAMSSHLLHKDADGIGMVWERFGRKEQRQQAVKLGHSARVVSDVCSFSKLRLLTLLTVCKEKANVMPHE